MFKKLLPFVFLLPAFSAIAQFKNDNVLYKTIDPFDLCAALQKNKGYLLLDVRSAGENCDTSSSGLNIGHLKGAKNIDVRELGGRLSEIKDYKDQPVFVYCSHSQRSRRASTMLADSGFTNVYNINGGMTALYYTNAIEKGCLQSMVETNNKYDIISAIDLCSKLSSGNKNVFVLDVRSDSDFHHISSDPKANAYGIIKQAVNIPLEDLEMKLSSIPKNKEIVITDLYGNDAAIAGYLLKKNGFQKVSVLIEGISRLLATDEKELACKNQWYQSPVNYNIMSTVEFGRFTESNKNYLLLDIRTADEFDNKSKDYWKNIGHLKNAVNIPLSDIDSRLAELSAYQDKDIVIYGFSSSPETFAAAQKLLQHGFKKITVLNNGLFNIRWTAANHKDMSYLKNLVIDVPEINW